MSVPDPVLELTQQWWLRAAEDLAAAKAARRQLTASCFHCQQAVEKAIKALLVLHQVEFEKTHDIGKLLAQLSQTPTPSPVAMTDGLRKLTRFAVETRYPPTAATLQDAKDALDKAEMFLVWVQSVLPLDGPSRP